MRRRRGVSIRFALALAALLAGVVFGAGIFARAAGNAAATVQLTKTEGTVEITDAGKESIPLIESMRLYNGYEVGTQEESYAWISLDKSKLAKLDALSEVGIRKRGKKLELLLDSGNLFFNVTEPLEEDESFNIRTSTMAIGIRGTSGWVEVLDERNVRVSILEGTVELTATDPVTGEEKTELLSAGESAVCVVYDGKNSGRGGDARCDIVRRRFTEDDVKGFVLKEVVPDIPLADEIYDKSGIDLRGVTKGQADERIRREQEQARRRLDKVELALAGQENVVATDLVWTKKQDGLAAKADRPTPGRLPSLPWQTPGADPTLPPGTDLTQPSVPVTPPGTGLTQPSGPTVSQNQVPTLYPTQPSSPAPTPTPVPPKWSYRGGTLTILDVGMMADLASRDDQPWGEYREEIKKVVVPEGVARIGNNVFSGCVNLQSAELPDSVTEIGDRAFYECKSLTSLAAQDAAAEAGLMALFGMRGRAADFALPPRTVEIGQYAFADCEGISGSLTIPDGVREIGQYAFANCKNISGSLTFPDGAKRIGEEAFSACEGLTAIEVPEGIVGIGNGAFAACQRLRDVYFYDTEEVWNSRVGKTLGNDPFRGISRPTMHFRSSGIDGGIRWSFVAWKNELTISSTGTDTGEMKDYANGNRPWEQYIDQIQTVVVERGVTTVGSNAFSGMNQLTSVELPGKITTVNSNAFQDCGKLTNVYFDGGQAAWNQLTGGNISTGGSSAPQMHFNVSGSSQGIDWSYADWSVTLTIEGNGPMPDFSSSGEQPWAKFRSKIKEVIVVDGVTGIGSHAFEDCSNLAEVSLPGSVRTVGAYAFEDCRKLSGVSLQKCTTVGEAAFAYSGLASVELPSGMSVGYRAFASSWGLKTVRLANASSIGDRAFSYCSGLKDVYFGGTWAEWKPYMDRSSSLFYDIARPNIHTSDNPWEYAAGTVTVSGNGAMPEYGETWRQPWASIRGSIQKVVVEDGVTGIGSHAFEDCSNLSEVTIRGSVTKIGDYAFEDCRKLAVSMSLPSCVTVGEAAFAYSGLTSVELPSGMSVGYRAFASNWGLKTVRLANASSIGDRAFSYCSGLKDVYFGGTEEEWEQKYGSRIGWIFYDIPRPKIHFGEEGLSLLELTVTDNDPTVTDNDPPAEEAPPKDPTVTDNAPQPEDQKEPPSEQPGTENNSKPEGKEPPTVEPPDGNPGAQKPEVSTEPTESAPSTSPEDGEKPPEGQGVTSTPETPEGQTVSDGAVILGGIKENNDLYFG